MYNFIERLLIVNRGDCWVDSCYYLNMFISIGYSAFCPAFYIKSCNPGCDLLATSAL